MRSPFINLLLTATTAALTFTAIKAASAPICIDRSRTIAAHSMSSFEVTEDNNFAFSSGYMSDKMQIIDLKTGRVRDVAKPQTSVVMSNGNDLVLFDIGNLGASSTKNELISHIRNGSIQVVNPSTGKITERRGQFPVRGGYAKPLDSAGSDLKLQMENGKVIEQPISLGNSGHRTFAGKTEDSPFGSLNPENGKVRIFTGDGQSFELQSEEFKSLNSEANLTPDGKYLLTLHQGSDGKKKLVTVDIAEKKITSFQLDNQQSGARIGDDYVRTGYNPKTGDLLLPHTGTLGVLSLNLKEGKPKKLANAPTGNEGYLSGSYFNRKGQVCQLRQVYQMSGGNYTNQTRRLCHDLGKDPQGPGEILIEGAGGSGISSILTDETFTSYTYSGSGNAQTMLLLKKEDCVTNPITVSCNCDIEKSAGQDSNLEDLKSVVLAAACGADYDSKVWDKITDRNQTNLSEGQAVTWLKRFSKPDGFNAETDLPILIGLLESEVSKSYPRQMKAVAFSLMMAEPRLFNDLSRKYPKIISLKGAPDTDCLSKAEKEKFKTGVYTTLKKEFSEGRNFEELRQLTEMGKDSLTNPQKEQLAEAASDRMTEIAGTYGSATEGIFSSKIHKFSLYQFQKMMGLPSRDITDFTVVRNPQELRILQLGREPFTGSTASPSGVYLKELSRIRVDDIKSDSRTEKYKWKYGDREFIGELQIDKIQFDESYIPPNKSPDYKDMWKDKEFRGVVIAGTNLGDSLTQQTMTQYVDYYVDQGFEFEPAQENNDMLSYLKEKVVGKGQMDYFIKEAHSGGDEKTMFDIGDKGHVLIGKKKVGDRTEVIELIYPKKGSYKNVAINNSEFGQWAREREKTGGSELLYLNTSCWSESKAIYEIPAAASKKLVNIPTTASITTFVNWDTNIMKLLVDGIRQEKDYEGIRGLLRKNTDYASGKSNILLFPDEPAYQTRIVQRVKTPFELNSKVSVKTADGSFQDYNIGRE